MIYLVTNRSLSTIRRLRDKIVDCGEKCVISRRRIGNIPRGSFVIPWGLVDDCTVSANKPESVAKSSSKYTARMEFKKAGIRVPNCWTVDAVPRNAQYPLIVRPTHHFAGRNFFVVENGAGLAAHRGGYASEIVDKSRELRLHVFLGTVIGIQEKPISEDIRANLAVNGDPWKVIGPSSCPKIAFDYSISAADAVGLDFGAVDIIRSRDGKWYVLEINTAPQISSEYILRKYAQAIIRMMVGNKPVADRDKRFVEEVK